MFYRIGKKLFEYLRNFLHFTQIALIFFCFFTVLYWILQIAQVGWINMFAPVFEPVKMFAHLFYNSTSTIDNVQIDFSFLLATFFFLLIVVALNYIIDRVEDLEKQFDTMHFAAKKKSEDIFNLALEKEYVFNETLNNKFMILVKFRAKNLKADSFYTKKTDDGVIQKEKEILSEFIEIISENFQGESQLLGENFLFYFNNMEHFNGVIDKLRFIINNLKKKYFSERWQINAFISVDVFARENEKIPKIKKLVMLNNLGLIDKILCFSSFQQRYLLCREIQYNIDVEGMYKLGENEEEVFVIKT